MGDYHVSTVENQNEKPDSSIMTRPSKSLPADRIDSEPDQPRHVEHRSILPAPLVLNCCDAISPAQKDEVSGSHSDSGLSISTSSSDNSSTRHPAPTHDHITTLRLRLPQHIEDRLTKNIAFRQQKHPIPYEEEDSWSDSDSAIGVASGSRPPRCPPPPPPPPPTPQDGLPHQPITQFAFTRAFERKMDVERHKAVGRYNFTEQRADNFNWSNDFYVDNDGHMGMWQDVTDDQHRHLVATNPSYALSSCHWHKSKVGPARQDAGAEEGKVPVLKLTDTEGEVWFLQDLYYYADEGGDDADGEEEDEDIYD